MVRVGWVARREYLTNFRLSPVIAVVESQERTSRVKYSDPSIPTILTEKLNVLRNLIGQSVATHKAQRGADGTQSHRFVLFVVE